MQKLNIEGYEHLDTPEGRQKLASALDTFHGDHSLRGNHPLLEMVTEGYVYEVDPDVLFRDALAIVESIQPWYTDTLRKIRWLNVELEAEEFMSRSINLENIKFELSQQRARQDNLNKSFNPSLSEEYNDTRIHLSKVVSDISAGEIKNQDDVAALLIYAISEISSDHPERAVPALEILLSSLELAGVDVDALGADHHVPSRANRQVKG